MPRWDGERGKKTFAAYCPAVRLAVNLLPRMRRARQSSVHVVGILKRRDKTGRRGSEVRSGGGKSGREATAVSL